MYQVMTVKELAEKIVYEIKEGNFMDFDFCLADPDAKNMDIKDVISDAYGWMGMKEIVGRYFDSDDFLALIDSYGGGDCRLYTMYNHEDMDLAVDSLMYALNKTIESREGCRTGEEIILLVDHKYFGW